MKTILSCGLLLALLTAAACSNEPKENAAYAAGGLYAEVALLKECDARFPEANLDIAAAQDALRAHIKKTDEYFIAINETKWLDYATDDSKTRVQQESARGTFTLAYCTKLVDDTIHDGPPERIMQRLIKF